MDYKLNSETCIRYLSWSSGKHCRSIESIDDRNIDFQLMALAAGMKTAKLKYGNRGHNQVNLSKKFHAMNKYRYWVIFSRVYWKEHNDVL